VATLEGATPGLRSAVERMIAESNGKLTLTSGFRSNAEQQRLWDASDKSGTWVAAPGKSNHEKGAAADIGGDLDYLRRVAPRYGLHTPMEWEPWHVELAGETRYDVGAHGTAPEGFTPGPVATPMDTLMSMMGGEMQPAFAYQLSARPSGGTMAMRPGDAPLVAGPEDTVLDAFRLAVRSKESGGDYGAIGSPTRWGTAKGAYQYLDGTWGNYKGYSTARDAPAAVQDEKARLDMQALYERFGDWNAVASAWFAGPNGNFASAEVRQYASDVIRRMGGGGR